MPTLDELQAQIAALNAKVERAIKGIALLVNHLGAAPQANGGNGQAAAPAVASDAELDGQRGDPEVKKDPKRWTGEPFAPRRMSLCSPDYLEAVAEAKDYSASRNDTDAANLDGEEQAKKRKYADYDRKDAARARGWARRLRERPARCDGAHGGAPCTDPGCYARPPQEEV